MIVVLFLIGGINYEIFKSNFINKLNKIYIFYIIYDIELVYIL